MRILVVGGTRFVGRHLVAAALAAGHEVTVVHRGSGCSAVAGAEHLHADRDVDLGILAGRDWDATVDTCAYRPRQVAGLADALADRGGRHLLVSTVSVYADAPEPGMDESAPLVAALGLDGEELPVVDETYGGLKVGCEHVAEQRHSGGLLIVRPTYIVGPHDPTGRFPYWVARMSHGGTVLAPGSPEAPMQQVDVRDLALLMVGLLEAGDAGTFNAVSPTPPYTWSELLDEVRQAVAPEGTRLVWIPSSWLVAHGTTPSSLPLWPGSDEPEFVLALDPARALAAGLRHRPLAETARDTLAWLRGGDGAGEISPERVGAAWLPAQREQQLLSQWQVDGRGHLEEPGSSAW